jgi:hypothetical protein
MSDKKREYLGYGKEAGQYGLINLSVEESVIQKNMTEYNGKRYLRFTVSKLKEPTKYGQTHTMWKDDFTPTSKNNAPQQSSVKGGDGLPWED